MVINGDGNTYKKWDPPIYAHIKQIKHACYRHTCSHRAVNCLPGKTSVFVYPLALLILTSAYVRLSKTCTLS